MIYHITDHFHFRLTCDCQRNIKRQRSLDFLLQVSVLTMLLAVIEQLGATLSGVLEFLPSAFSAPPPTDPPRLRIGLGGDIPVAPVLVTILVIAGGFVVPASGAFWSRIIPNETVSKAARAISSLVVATVAANTKKRCDVALQQAGTKATFQPVPSIADTGPYAVCRNPMYWALCLGLPGFIGLVADNAWVAFGSSTILWMYLHFVVVPAEEAFLEHQLGDAYKKYCASVKRWGLF